MQIIEVLILSLGSLILLSVLWSTVSLGISPTPTTRKVKGVLLLLIPEDLKGEVVELGAGWGTLAWAVASRCPHARVIGWEASLVPYLFCKIRSIIQPRANLSLRFGNFHKADLRNTKLVLTYLWAGAMAKLAPKFDSDLPAGSMVISHTFAWRGRTPAETRSVADLYRTTVYLYRILTESTSS